MGFKCGIVGLPNVGKSTLFNALTAANIQAENYPFCTIEPNVGMVPMPDKRLDVIAGIVNPQKVIATTMQFVDIAGLVKGASKGEGLGNKFLSHIREVDAIAHVVRCFEDENVTHVDGKVDPIADIETIHTELAISDLESLDKALKRTEKNAKSGNKEAKAQIELIKQLIKLLEDDKPIRAGDFDKSNQGFVNSLHLLTAKPLMYIANVTEDGFVDNPHLDTLKNFAEKENAEVVAICASMEAEIATLDDEDKTEFLKEMNLAEPGLNRVIRAGYRLLQLETYFTAGVKEVRAWTIPVGASAPQAAGKIHTDFEKGFIRAEIVGYDDFVAHQGEQGAKEAGKWRLEGKDYIVQDGDVIHFRFNV